MAACSCIITEATAYLKCKSQPVMTSFDTPNDGRPLRTSNEHNTRTSIEHPLNDGCWQGRSQFAAILKAGIVDNPHVSHGCFPQLKWNLKLTEPTLRRTDEGTDKQTLIGLSCLEVCWLQKLFCKKSQKHGSSFHVDNLKQTPDYLPSDATILNFYAHRQMYMSSGGLKKKHRFYHSLRLQKHLITY